MAKSVITLFMIFLTISFFNSVLYAVSIADQPGHEIICTGPGFMYSHDVRQHGIDENLTISGDAGFVVETGNPYASFYTDNSKRADTAVYQYSFVAEQGKVFGDVSVASRASVYENGNTVIGEYQIGEGSWIQFLFLDSSGDIRPVDVFGNIHDSSFKVRYTLIWSNAYWADGVQLFRSWGAVAGQPGDYAFTFIASIVGDSDCHKADLAGEVGEGVFIDLEDFTVFALDFGQTGSDLAGDIDGNGSCDVDDLKWLAAYWLCDCS